MLDNNNFRIEMTAISAEVDAIAAELADFKPYVAEFEKRFFAFKREMDAIFHCVDSNPCFYLTKSEVTELKKRNQAFGEELANIEKRSRQIYWRYIEEKKRVQVLQDEIKTASVEI